MLPGSNMCLPAAYLEVTVALPSPYVLGQGQLGAWLGQLCLAPLAPPLGGLKALECLAFLIDLLAIPKQPNLGRIPIRAVTTFSLSDRGHASLVHESFGWVHCTRALSKTRGNWYKQATTRHFR